MTVYHRGFHGDLNETLLVGNQVKEETRKLVKVTYECLQHAINIGNYFEHSYFVVTFRRICLLRYRFFLLILTLNRISRKAC